MTTLLDRMYKKYGWNDKNPPPHYVGDRGWSMNRSRRQKKIHEIIFADRCAKPPRQASKKTLFKLRILIEETEGAIRNNPETRSSSIVEQSRFFQGLLLSWFDVTKDTMISG